MLQQHPQQPQTQPEQAQQVQQSTIITAQTNPQVPSYQPKLELTNNNSQQQKQEKPQEDGEEKVQLQQGNSYGISDMIEKIGDNVRNGFQQLIDGIGRVQEPEVQEDNDSPDDNNNNNDNKNIDNDNNYNEDLNNRTQQQQQQHQQQDEKEQKLQQIRKKQQELLEQLNLLKQQQQQLISGPNNPNSNNSQSNQPSQQQQQQQVLFQFKTKQILSPVKSPRRYIRTRAKPQLVMPPPITPEMSRNQFQMKVKQIASHIRSKVQKYNPLTKQLKQIRQSKIINKGQTSKSLGRKSLQAYTDKYRIQLKLPDIEPKSTKYRNFTNNTSQIRQVRQQIKLDLSKLTIQQNGSSLIQPKDNQINQKATNNTTDNKNYKAMKSIVIQIIKQTFQKIRYKQKYGIKLDPVHHKYPMTTFRKQIIQEKSKKYKDRSMTQSLRKSMLNQRKQIYAKSKLK